MGPGPLCLGEAYGLGCTSWGSTILMPRLSSSVFFLLIPPFCWLCQALGLVYMSPFLSWLTAAVAGMMHKTPAHSSWLNPSTCLPSTLPWPWALEYGLHG